jgi:hypothetical protein
MKSLLIDVLADIDIIQNLNDKQWDLLTKQARSAKLLGRLYYLLKCSDKLSFIPSSLLWHYIAIYKVAERQRIAAIREAFEISTSLAAINIKPTFIKGSAYAIADLPITYGRLMSDIDVLVLKSEISTSEDALFACGWLKSKMDNYDEKYYRQWMHEIPPLKHISRQTTLDLHHNILPLTNKNSFDANVLSKDTITHNFIKKSYILGNIDMVIHSTVHLFSESEFHNGLRDLSDLDMLIKQFSQNNHLFVNELVERANKLGLANYVWLSLRYTKLVFKTPINETDIVRLNYQAKTSLHIKLLDFCFLNILKPDHKSCRNWKMNVAEIILYWRGHLLRMPLKLLVPHLYQKLMMQIKDRFNKEKAELPHIN